MRKHRSLSSTCLTGIAAVFAASDNASAQVCPAPFVAVSTSCTVTPGSTITVTAAGAIGMNESGASAVITADGIIVNLAAATTTGGRAQPGGGITFNGSTLRTTSVGAAATGQIGLIATGGGSTIAATGATITMVPATGNANNMTAVVADGGGAIQLGTTSIIVGGGANGVADHGMRATGTGSTIQFSGGTVETRARGSFGILAESAGAVTLSGAQITTIGAQTTGTTPVGSHALFATGADSLIGGTGVTATASGGLANAARAESGGVVNLSASTLRTTGAGTVANPSAAGRAVSGGVLQLSNSVVEGTGQFGHGLSVQGAGSQAMVTGTSVTASGTRSNAVQVADGGIVTVTGGSLTGNNGVAVDLTGAGSSITLTDVTVASTAATAHGVRGLLGSAVTISGGSITTQLRDATALTVSSATATATNVTIVTNGTDNAMGALADLGGRIDVTGGSITTNGDSVRAGARAHGMAARNPGGTLTSIGTSVLTRGQEAMGVVADDGGVVTLTGNTIVTENRLGLGLFSVVEQVGPQFPASITATGITVETSGLNAYGVMAQQNFLEAPAVATINNSSVLTRGPAATGLRAVSAGTVNANLSTVATHGLAAHGLQSRDNGSTVNLDQTSILATGAVAHGALAESGGLVNGNRAAVIASGANSAALYAAGAPGFVSTANFTNSVLSNISGPTIAVGGHANVTLTGTIAGGSGQWLRVGTITDFPSLAAPDPPLTGVPDLIDDPAVIQGPILPALPPPAALPVVPGLANVTLSRATVIGTAFTAPGSVSNLTLRDNSLWIMTGDSNVTNLLNDPSEIRFTPPVGGVFKTLTVVNYIGEGGILGLNTFLSTDGSPSDRLVVDGGTATGASLLRIANAGGPGAVTRGNGILVVDAINGAATVPGAFSLAAPVVAGPYEYTLFRSSVDASNPQAWYLRSTIDCSPGAPSPPCPGPQPSPPGPGPDPQPAPNPPVPNFRVETSMYAALPAMALLYGRNLLDTLHERVGELAFEHASAEPGRRGTWGRVIGMHGEREGDRLGIFGSGPHYEYDFLGLQVGQDLYRGEGRDGVRDHAGVYFAFGDAQGRVTHFDGRRGDADFKGYSLGAYWTHFGPSGWYVDAIVQGTWYDANSHAGRGLPALTTDGFGFAGSIEAGYPFQLGDGFFIEPQAQLVLQTIDLGDGSDGAASVRFDQVDSLAGRLGLRFGRSWRLAEGPDLRRATAWLRPNLWHEFKGDPVTLFSSATGFLPFRAHLGGTWFELNAGLSAQASQTTSLYANVAWQTRFDTDSFSYTGKVGLRTTW